MKSTAHSLARTLGIKSSVGVGKSTPHFLSATRMKFMMLSLLGSFLAGTAACNEDDSKGESQSCGGLLGQACDAGEFCKFPADAMCGIADATGICEPIPQVCDQLHAPVCGCDGKTYSNDCSANAAGVSVAHSGECPDESTLGKSCGGKVADQPRACDAGQFCNYRPEDLCGRADAPGICKEIPTACDDVAAPVCGCDGKDYSNECEANAAGTAAEKMGPCSA